MEPFSPRVGQGGVLDQKGGRNFPGEQQAAGGSLGTEKYVSSAQRARFLPRGPLALLEHSRHPSSKMAALQFKELGNAKYAPCRPSPPTRLYHHRCSFLSSPTASSLAVPPASPRESVFLKSCVSLLPPTLTWRPDRLFATPCFVSEPAGFVLEPAGLRVAPLQMKRPP